MGAFVGGTVEPSGELTPAYPTGPVLPYSEWGQGLFDDLVGEGVVVGVLLVWGRMI